MGTVKSDTISYYNLNADKFFSDTVDADMSYCIDKFMYYLKEQNKSHYRILDAGCGSGRDTRVFLDKGYEVDAFDASEEMCKKAAEYTGIEVKHMTFEELSVQNTYDGIWACASLLHVEKDKLKEVVENLSNALTENGIIYASFKYGTGERVKDGRFFTDMTEDKARKLFEDAGLDVLEVFITGDVREGRVQQKWVNVIGSKKE